MLLYYITDRTQFPGNATARRRALLEKIDEAASCGVDFIQLREKDLNTRDLESLTQAAAEIVQLRTRNRELITHLLANARSDIALACQLSGVHLPGNDISPSEARRIWVNHSQPPIISVSCHSPEEVGRAASQSADYALFAPVFEKQAAPDLRPAGLEALRAACRHSIPVLALGGVTLENAGACLESGAVGIAAIRLFQDHPVRETVEALRSIK